MFSTHWPRFFGPPRTTSNYRPAHPPFSVWTGKPTVRTVVCLWKGRRTRGCERATTQTMMKMLRLTMTSEWNEDNKASRGSARALINIVEPYTALSSSTPAIAHNNYRLSTNSPAPSILRYPGPVYVPPATDAECLATALSPYFITISGVVDRRATIMTTLIWINLT